MRACNSPRATTRRRPGSAPHNPKVMSKLALGSENTAKPTPTRRRRGCAESAPPLASPRPKSGQLTLPTPKQHSPH
eukprot:498199-Pyramimonas_sp.AAC.1